MLGGYGAPDESLRWVGVVVFLAALGATGVLERIQFRLRFLEARTWWASNGRDVLNALAFALMAVALGFIGFGGPIGLVIAASIVLLVNTVQTTLGVRRGATFLSVLTALCLGAPVLLAPAWVDGVVAGMLLWLFPADV
jgi:hypothetical protein